MPRSKTWTRSSLAVFWAAAAALWHPSRALCVEEEVSVTDPPLRSNQFELSMMTLMRAIQGSFDPYGSYHAYPDGSSAWSAMTMLGIGFRFSSRWEISGTVPIRRSQMVFPTGSSTSTSLGGPLFDVRYHLGGWPHLMIHAGGTPPLQLRTLRMNGDPSASLADDFEDGGFPGSSVHLGVGAFRSFHRFKAALDMTALIPFSSSMQLNDGPPDQPAVIVRQGDRVQLSEGLGYMVSRNLAILGSLRQIWGASTYADGLEVPGTQSRLFSTSFGASYSSDPNWRWTATYQTQFPFYAYAVNQSYAPAVSFGMSYMGI